MEENADKTVTITGIERFLNQVVTITVKDGRKISGKLVEHDEHMNLLLEEAEELDKEIRHKLMVIKGGNVSDISI